MYKRQTVFVIEPNDLEVKLKLYANFIVKDVIALDPLARSCLLYTSDAADDMQCVDLGGRRIIKKKKKKKKKYYFFFFFFPSTPFALFFFFFSSRRRHTRFALVSWARRCV